MIDVHVQTFTFVMFYTTVMLSKNRTYRNKDNSSFVSKGDRMGWVSKNQAKDVRLSAVLTEGRVVSVKQSDRRPLLVP